MASIKKGTRSRYWIAAFRDKNGRSQNKSTKIERLGGSAQERVDRKKKAQAIADDFERIALGGHKEEKHLREAAFNVATKAKGVEIKEISAYRPALWIGRWRLLWAISPECVWETA